LDRFNEAGCVISWVDNDRVSVRHTLEHEQPTPEDMIKRKHGDVYLLAWRATERDGWVTEIAYSIEAIFNYVIKVTLLITRANQ